MRVMSADLRRTRDAGDRGAVLVIVAVFMLVAALFMAFVVDIGNQREDRRQLTAGTDAPAIAVAHEWAAAGGNPLFNCGSSPTAQPLARDNNPQQGELPATYSCTFSDVTPFRGGIVTVRSTEDVDYSFDGITGVDASSVGSLTRVKAEPEPGGGVRPVALCTGDFVPDDPTGLLTLAQRLALAGWTQEAADNTVWRAPVFAADVEFTNTTGNSTNPCRANGNWNAVVFRVLNECPGQSNPAGGATDFRDQYANGSPYDVAVNDCISRVPGNGGFSSGDPDIIEGMYIWFPVFETAEGGGAGIYKVVGFIEAFVEDVQHHGQTTTFELLPRRFMTSGTCCLLNEYNLKVTLCDVGTLGGGQSATSDADCLPRDTTGNPVDPGLSDPCLVTNVNPDPLQVPVDGSGFVAEARLVTVEVADYVRCGVLTLDAVDDAIRTSATFVERVDDNYVFEFSIGDELRPAGSVLDIEVFDDGDLLDDEARLHTTAYVPPAPVCLVESVTPLSQTVPVSNSSKKSTAVVSWQVVVTWPSSCGLLTGKLVSGTDEVAINGGSPLTRIMTFELPVGSTFPNGKHSGHPWSVRLYDQTGTLRHSLATATT